MYNNGKVSNELWAVINDEGSILWSRGGSSSRPKLMVYGSLKEAKTALKNPWIKQIHKDKIVRVVQIYCNGDNPLSASFLTN